MKLGRCRMQSQVRLRFRHYAKFPFHFPLYHNEERRWLDQSQKRVATDFNLTYSWVKTMAVLYKTQSLKLTDVNTVATSKKHLDYPQLWLPALFKAKPTSSDPRSSELTSCGWVIPPSVLLLHGIITELPGEGRLWSMGLMPAHWRSSVVVHQWGSTHWTILSN